ncbi:hypothetical protein [Celeribacter sp.]|uniref:hypothetical protein n=1 Tax=Celeribacter sp. TaxID=1890673 RepID=UPI003A9262A9
MADLGNDDIIKAKAGEIFPRAASFSLRNRLERLAFSVAWLLLARWTPPPMHGLRRGLLRLFGAQIGTGAHIYSSARIWHPKNLVMADDAAIGPRAQIYNMGTITIGKHAVISQGAHLCAGTHDHRVRNFQLLAKPIVIGDGAWVAAEAFVGPGVTVGADAVAGARAVCTRDLAPNTVYAGNPAVEKGTRYDG